MNQKGTVLVETLIALGAAVVIIAAITTMVISALNNAQSAKSQGLAAQLAQEGLEITRNLSRSNWGYFYSLAGDYCLAANSSEFDAQVPCSQNIGNFIRTINISHEDNFCSGSSRVTSTVSWTDSNCKDRNNIYCHSVALQSCIANTLAFPNL